MKGAKMDKTKVQLLLDELVCEGVLPGASVLVRKSGKELLFYQVGWRDVEAQAPVTRDTLFCLYSMTKPVTTAALMSLVDRGLVSLEDEVSRFIPEMADMQVFVGKVGDDVRTEPARRMTVRHLLTHTAGISYWFYPDQPVAKLYSQDSRINEERWRFEPELGGEDGLIASLAKLPLVAQPGERWHYGMALEVAGIIVERISGQRLDVYMKQYLFDPLGMNDTSFWVDDGDVERLAAVYQPTDDGFELMLSPADNPVTKTVAGFAGGGGLVSTIDDYDRFAQMLLSGGVGNGRRVLSEASVREMMTDQLSAEQLGELPGLAEWGLGGSGRNLGFGLGGCIVLAPPNSETPAFRGEYSWGGAASTTFWVDPENDVAVTFMTQLQPPVTAVPRDRLHQAVYGALGMAGPFELSKQAERNRGDVSMRVVVFGAAGGVGRALVAASLAKGYEVTAFVHHRVTDLPAAVVQVEGDALDPDAVKHAVSGQDAVLDALGGKAPWKSTGMEPDAARNIIAAMTQSGVRRLIVVSAMGAGDSAELLNPFYEYIVVPTLLRGSTQDKNAAEAKLSAARDLDWTVVRPAPLTDEVPGGPVQLFEPGEGKTAHKASRASVARFMVDQLESDRYIRKAVNIAES